MTKILTSPGKYVQGPGEMKKLGEYAAKYGKKALALITENGYRRSGADAEAGFKASGTDIVFDYFNGECCKKEIDRLIEDLKEYSSLIREGRQEELRALLKEGRLQKEMIDRREEL